MGEGGNQIPLYITHRRFMRDLSSGATRPIRRSILVTTFNHLFIPFGTHKFHHRLQPFSLSCSFVIVRRFGSPPLAHRSWVKRGTEKRCCVCIAELLSRRYELLIRKLFDAVRVM